jgi:hypothetical protein
VASDSLNWARTGLVGHIDASKKLSVVCCLLPVAQKRESMRPIPRPFPACCLRPEVLPAGRSVPALQRRAESCRPCGAKTIPNCRYFSAISEPQIPR